ncbi:LysR family transcriptional regulator [Litorilituus lipolyticus]|uniref:LysR family transcriptional regulator n=1 Tax=Litorilituus lipolyticus TaxID=2491017 RepID=A0A502KP73_9GAMM|nr:LysR family transcriptional regulator [Litorilituus lipolyticus]TPH13412.1 LysR family transcriptional regulator [Litorilituus lipolyticus]
MSTINRLTYFNCVVEKGSISEASKHLDVQPSSISRQLVALEEELGVRLLNRTTRNVGLTEAGHKYYEYSQRVVAELEEAKRAINELQGNPTGTLRLSMTVGFGECVILPLIPLFREQYPNIDVELELTERVVDLIDENIDIAIRSGRLSDSTLISKHLMPNNFVVCASPSYLAKYGEPLTPNELDRHSCIKYSYRGWREWFIINETPSKLSIGKGLSINSVNGQKQLLLSHAGLALIPLWAVKEELNDGTLVQVLPQYVLSPYETLSSTYAIYLKRELTAPKTRVFLDFIASHFQNSNG